MKKLLVPIIVAAVISSIMFFTNPNEDVFQEAIDTKITKVIDDAPPLEKLLATGLKGVASAYFAKNSERQNFALFSIFKLDMGDEEKKYLGMFGQIIPLQKQEINEWEDLKKLFN